MKGIILAGGSGTRLHPCTHVISKQLLPIYDKPMIYYPLSTLMLSGIRDILVISTPVDLPQYRRLLGDGKRLGINFSYAEQPRPEGLPQAFTIGRDFIGDSPCCLILGDNVFFGQTLTQIFRRGVKLVRGALLYGYYVNDPERYGVVEFSPEGKVLSLEEKPQAPKSRYAITGYYMFGPGVAAEAGKLVPGRRGEYEMVDLLRSYLHRDELQCERLGRGVAWLDTGTNRSLLEASNFIQTIEERQGLQVACLEEIAWQEKWIGPKEVEEAAEAMGKSAYGEYLRKLLESGPPVAAPQAIKGLQ